MQAQPCPLYPQKQTSQKRESMSAKGQKQTFCAAAKAALLFDHPVGTRKKRRLNYQTERFRGLEIDDEVKFDGLLDR